MKTFGPIADPHKESVPLPLGQSCLWCDEKFVAGDSGFAMPLVGVSGVRECYYHRECLIRSIVGSVGHQQRRCSCYVKGSTEEDPSGMTRRMAARMAYVEFALHMGNAEW